MRITGAALQRVLDMLDADLSHIALDAGVPTEQGLANEYFRSQLTPAFRDGDTTVREIYLDETQANGSIQGFGLIAAGTDDPGTGVLFGFSEADMEKTDRNSLTISVELTVEVVD